MKSLLHVLVVEDSMDDAELMVREIQRGGYAVEFERVETQAGMEEALSKDSGYPNARNQAFR
jgi:hypothetical protein